jgi:transposase
MGKTRGQPGNTMLKKEQEEEEDCKPSLVLETIPTENTAIKEEEDCKPTLLLNGVSNTRSSCRMEKRKSPTTNNRHLPIRQVKLEEVEEVEEDNVYINNPEMEIPVPRKQTPRIYKQEQIGNLIRYINSDKMTAREASAKANISYQSACRYYKSYLKDPNHAIPVQQLLQTYTQEQKSKLIGYVVHDKMSITAASKKANMSNETGRKYYHQYLKDRNIDGPMKNVMTRDQINQLIGYVVDDKMSVTAAAKKVNVPYSTAYKY